MGETIMFAGLSAVLIGGAVGMLMSRNVVHAAFWLLAATLASAGVFALLHAGYVALVQVLVYAGAVAILNLFTIMITLRRQEDAIRPRDFSVAGLGLAVLFFGMVAYGVLSGPLPETVVVERYPGVLEFGELLFSPDGWALPFEIASLVLTAALIGAVWWSREERRR